MPLPTKVKYIVIHCSAGFSLIPDIENFWYNTLKWKSAGYHIIIYPDGQCWYITKNNKYSTDIREWYPQAITNGVSGYNSQSIHICYIGGVEKVNNKWIAKDTRTEEQKVSIIYSIIDTLSWLNKNGINIENKKIDILGHRDFSPDKNGNGVIESWERTKECPCFDAIDEYFWIVFSSKFGRTILPTK